MSTGPWIKTGSDNTFSLFPSGHTDVGIVEYGASKGDGGIEVFARVNARFVDEIIVDGAFPEGTALWRRSLGRIDEV